jgi:hypothetical protein
MVKFSHLVAGGVLGNDAAQLLGGVPDNVVWCLEGWRLLCVAHATSGHLCPWPLRVMAVFPPVPVLALVPVSRVPFDLRAHIPLASLSVTLGFNTLGPSP